jgi:hypothetical protein
VDDWVLGVDVCMGFPSVGTGPKPLVMGRAGLKMGGAAGWPGADCWSTRYGVRCVFGRYL